MTRTISLCIALLLATTVFAQPGPPGAQQQNTGMAAPSEDIVGRLLSMPEAMLKMDISDIGELKNVKVQLVKLTNLSKKDMRVNLVRFVYGYTDINSPAVKAIYTEVSGIDELTRNFNKLQTEVFSQKSTGYSEVMFRTRDGITGGCYWSQAGWAPYMKLADTDDSYVLLAKDDFSKLMSLLDLIKSKLIPDAPSQKK
jgi:hypothetical protein